MIIHIKRIYKKEGGPAMDVGTVSAWVFDKNILDKCVDIFKAEDVLEVEI